ncbi:indole-3-glycerol phosphate synthase TrpC [Nesterenkonia sphaerica]|uniref:Indole-3-glycerol phosphate synthase n=1 Tax=Nesterenkonia sphaerica TaxID=1804988 RepID=A0A5R9AGZ7_9MICC|nr:indole-3-glycerol phosphate synthase TrpC [Nesterenkonia sphaerica]TLP77434.1 indole-3-glycerol phosphate synthase TrpC [Nesterenkonia sphaerica]
MTTVLDSIIDGVREDLAARQEQVPLATIRQQAATQPPALDALQALQTGRTDTAGVRIIAEVKRSSPSKGALAQIADPGALAAAYQAGGASVISVLTEPRRFGGSLDDLAAVRAAVDIPVLRKDFMVEEYQFHEARAYGADLVLLIVAALDDAQLRDFLALTHDLGMNALVEAHTEEEIERAVAVGARIVGVNVRNLKTLDVDVNHYSAMARHLPPELVQVAESGVTGPDQVLDYARQGADAVLVGEALVKHGNPTEAVRSFRAASLAKEAQ